MSMSPDDVWSLDYDKLGYWDRLKQYATSRVYAEVPEGMQRKKVQYELLTDINQGRIREFSDIDNAIERMGYGIKVNYGGDVYIPPGNLDDPDPLMEAFENIDVEGMEKRFARKLMQLKKFRRLKRAPKVIQKRRNALRSQASTFFPKPSVSFEDYFSDHAPVPPEILQEASPPRQLNFLSSDSSDVEYLGVQPAIVDRVFVTAPKLPSPRKQPSLSSTDSEKYASSDALKWSIWDE